MTNVPLTYNKKVFETLRTISFEECLLEQGVLVPMHVLETMRANALRLKVPLDAFFLVLVSYESRCRIRRVKTREVHGRNFKQKRSDFRGSIDGDARVSTEHRRTPWGTRVAGCARDHPYE